MTGSFIFLRAFLRRDRPMLPWWLLGCTLLYWSQAVSVKGLYTTQADFDRAAASMAGNSAFIAMTGPTRALNTIGGQVTWQASAYGAIVAALMGMFIIGRHTRAEEESGRDELVRSGAVGRLAPMSAAFAEACLANLAMGTLVFLSLVLYGLATPGAAALGVGLAAVGIAFAGVALIAAQLTGSTRSMYGITGAVIGVAYALRAIGDLTGDGLSWLSPIGWYQAMHAYSGERWWPLLLPIVAAALAIAVAYAVFVRRDIGAGVVAARPGPARAADWLHHRLGLAWRLNRGSVAGWSLGMFAGGLAYGSIGSDVRTLIGTSKTAKDMFLAGGGSIVDSFYATAALMLTLIASGFSVGAVLRTRGEEDDGHLEPLLATGMSRRTWLTGQMAVTVLGTLAVLLAAGLGLGLGYAGVTGDGSAIGRLTWAVLSLVPAVLVLVAITRLLYAIAPRVAFLGWLALGYCAVMMLFGTLLRLPHWLVQVSPFAHLALVPAQSVDWTAFIVVLLVAGLLSGAAARAFGRRDVH